ncbi:SDR family oxidoreductase [Streptomyces sp. NPDC005574]|uniref:SDR family oxidoreductase n=1 Tax=Streptomyces sp. NPDC005574 TaxID=3156891 RepID=UPI0033A1F807
MAKTKVITGTASGLGFATVEKFADRGWNVVATTRDDRNPFPDRANVRVLALDVTDLPAVAAFGTLAADQFGPVDVLVNNAGYYQMGPLETSPMEQIRAQYETNVFGLIALTQSFLPAMRARRSGTIVNLSSISAHNGYPYTSVYGSSKAAVLSLTEALNVELAPLGIVAKAILPGTHATDIFTKIDLADDFPGEYHPLFRRFLDAQTALTGSPASTVADAVWEAVHDGNDDKVRYYAGPDATSIPVTKRLLGQERYFATVKKAILNGPGRLGRLLSREGGTPMRVDLGKADRVLNKPHR